MPLKPRYLRIKYVNPQVIENEKAVYLEFDQWDLVDSILLAATKVIAKDQTRSLIEPTTVSVLQWSNAQIMEIRQVIQQSCQVARSAVKPAPGNYETAQEHGTALAEHSSDGHC